MKALITGAFGFVGRYLSKRLAEAGAEVLGLDLSVGAAAEGRCLPCDILDLPRLEQIVSEFGPDRIFHLAGLVHPAESKERPLDYYRTNVQGTVNLLEVLRLSGSGARLLVVSSAEVYGGNISHDAIAEETPLKPLNHYAASKMVVEQIALQYREQNGLWVVLARPFNHSGPGQPPRFVIPDFCRQVAEAEIRAENQSGYNACLQVGNLEAEKDFLDVRDVVDAYAKLLEQGNSGGIYNISSGKGTMIRNILDTVVRKAHINITVETSREKYRPLQFPRQVGDNTKLQTAIEWQPRFDIKTTIADTLEYWRDGLRSGLKES